MGACTSALNVETPPKPLAEMSGVVKGVITVVALTVETVVSVPIVAVRLAVAVVAGAVATVTVVTMFTGLALLQCVALLFSSEITYFWEDTAEIMGEGTRELGRLVWYAVRPPFR